MSAPDAAPKTAREIHAEMQTSGGASALIGGLLGGQNTQHDGAEDVFGGGLRVWSRRARRQAVGEGRVSVQAAGGHAAAAEARFDAIDEETRLQRATAEFLVEWPETDPDSARSMAAALMDDEEEVSW